MPYFTRKSWHETAAGIAGIAPAVSREPDVPAHPADDDALDIAELAHSILSSDDARSHATEGPFRCRKPVPAGEIGVITLSVDLDGDGEHLELNLSPNDLRTRAGDTIPGARVSLSPDQIVIPPGGSRSFEVQVHVPRATRAGLYRGRVFGSGPSPVAFVVEFEVTAPAQSSTRTP